MSNLDKLREAWEVAPPGSKARLYKVFNFNRVTANDIIRNGRKDESTILRLLYAIKQSSKDVLKEVTEANNKIQKI